MKTPFTLAWHAAALFFAFILVSADTQAQIGMGPRQNSYTQSFDGLPATSNGTWKNGEQYLPGWFIYRSAKDSTITANTGSAVKGGVYSYGTSNSTDRALGSISSATAGYFTYNLLMQNNSGNPIKSVEIKYAGEQWRVSNSTAPQHTISVWYAISSAPENFNNKLPNKDEGWQEIPELTFLGPKYKLKGSELNGNASENSGTMSYSLQVEIPDGHYIMLRWKDADDYEQDHGLAIDDVTVTWHTQTAEMPAPLPVELAYFKAGVRGLQVELQWQTASEDQNSHFVVERSHDGKIFEGIGLIAGQGTTAQISDYTFMDEVPLAGTSYYRLKQVDEDESYTYSKVVSVTRKVRQEISVFPTVTTNELQVRSDVRLRQGLVIDVMGKKLREQQLQTYASQHVINVSGLENGTYVLVLLDEHGKRYVNRFVKQ